MTERSQESRPAGLGRIAVRAAGSVLFGQLARILLQVGSVIVLTRLLTPHDHGLLATAMLLVGLGEVFRDFGLSTAAVQAKSLTPAQRDTLFWLSAALGLGFSVAMFAAAPLVAWWGRSPELVGVCQWLSLVFLLNGLVSQYRAGLNRAMRFNALVLSDLIANLVGIVAAVVMALTGWGYWALVGQQLVGGLTLLAIVVVQSGWLPGPPKRGSGVRSMVKFGLNLAATQLVGYLNNNVDNIIILTRMGTAPLGVYGKAYQLIMRTVNQLRGPTTTVALPIQARLDTHQRKADFVITGQLALGYSLVPLITFAVAASTPLVGVFLGPAFQGAAPVFALLGIAAIFQTVAYVGYWVYLARGLTKYLLTYSLMALAVRASTVLIGSNWGIVGAAAGFAICDAISWPLSIWWLSRHTPMPIRRLYAGAARILAMAGMAGAAAYLALASLGGLFEVAQLVVAVAVVVAAYALGALLVPVVRRDLQTLIVLVRQAMSPSDAG